MKATVYYAPGDVRVENVPDPTIQQPTDAIVRITHACICGSDLWFYRGEEEWQPGWRTGHEWMGIVEEVGSEVRTLKKGDACGKPLRVYASSLPLRFLMAPVNSAIKEFKPLAYMVVFGEPQTMVDKQKPFVRPWPMAH